MLRPPGKGGSPDRIFLVEKTFGRTGNQRMDICESAYNSNSPQLEANTYL